ncbi:hypothetical protein FM113_10645 [Leucobacter sp. 7(1)]|nr:hypothetical protein FM113_10645 [Leucobacter sp. 7(1)]
MFDQAIADETFDLFGNASWNMLQGAGEAGDRNRHMIGFDQGPDHTKIPRSGP